MTIRQHDFESRVCNLGIYWPRAWDPMVFSNNHRPSPEHFSSFPVNLGYALFTDQLEVSVDALGLA
jgi:hypothetical protein